MPQTRYVLRKALEAGPAADRGHQQGRPHQRARRRGAAPDPGPLPRAGDRRRAARLPGAVRQRPRAARAGARRRARLADDLRAAVRDDPEHVPAPAVDPEGAVPDAGRQRSTTTVPGPHRARARRPRRAAAGRLGSCASTATAGSCASGSASVFAFEGLKRVPVERGARPATSSLIAGLDDVQIGDTLADPPMHRRRCRASRSSEPTVSMTFGVNTSPFAGREGKCVTSRQLRARLFRELETNVALRVEETDSAGRVPGLRARRAAPGDPGRDDAPRGLRVPGLAARGHHPRGRRRAASSRSSTW